MNDNTRRFLNTVLERLPGGGAVVELRLFPAIRQGGIESAVAVVAVDVPEDVVAPVGTDETAGPVETADTADTPDVAETVELPDASEAAEPPDAPALKRYAILTARYRHTFKGPDRGKWDVEITHEADAPLATVERVARGVARRSGDESEPEHFSAESLRHALESPAWLSTT